MSAQDDIKKLIDSQAEARTELRNLSNRVDKHIETIETRFSQDTKFKQAQVVSLTTLTSQMKEVCDDVLELKQKHECLDKRTDKIEGEQKGIKAEQKTQSWFIKSVVGITIIASLGGIVGGIVTCNTDFAQAEATTESVTSP